MSLEVLGVAVECCFPCALLRSDIGLVSVTLLHVQQVALGHQEQFGGYRKEDWQWLVPAACSDVSLIHAGLDLSVSCWSFSLL